MSELIGFTGMGRKEKSMSINSSRRRTSWKGLTVAKMGILIAIFLLCFAGLSREVKAQEYPAKPITMLIGFPVGGVVDVCTRALAEEAKKFLGQEIVIVNKPGGGGAVGVGILANSKGDGYTLLATTTSCLTNTPHIESVPYDPLKDIVPIIQFGNLITVCGVISDSPHGSFQDFIEFARRNPGKVSCCISGIGTTPHLAMELVNQRDNINISLIPTEGTPKSMAALLGRHVTAVATSIGGMIPYVNAGKARILVTTADKRIEVIPNVPTLFELGYSQGVLIELYLILAPKGTPLTVVKKLEEAFRRAMETPEFINITGKLYLYVKTPLAGEKLKEFIEKEYAKNGEIIRKAKLGK
jgi:tripartite-type tricarboxylate transporter receptor subunit TctC